VWAVTTPLVSCVVPTIGRPELHQQLYEGFVADQWPSKELVVLDEGPEPSPFFTQLQDTRVRYHHEPHPKTETNRIGAARNRLVQLARGDFISHRDDDDEYHPAWLSFAMERLGDADLLKLDVYWIITDSDPAYIFEWDTRQFGGEHYAMRGEEIKKTQVDKDSMPAEVIEMFRDGYGYSLFGPRRTFEQFPFPEEGTEDFPFMRAVRAAGKKIQFVSDAAHMILHLVSKRSKSGVFPQKFVGAAGAPYEGLGRALGRRMVGLLGAMNELPAGQAIDAKPGVTYSVLASISEENTLKSLATTASKWGVHISEVRDNVDPSEFGVQAPEDGYRLVHVTATVDKDAKVPWKVPPPLDVFNKSSVVRAWTNDATGVGAPVYKGLPPRATAVPGGGSGPSPVVGVVVVVGLLGTAVAGWWLLSRKPHKKRAKAA